MYFFLRKQANLLLRIFITTHWEHFKALIRRTDGCTEVLWLLVQAHHIIPCSHKRYKNRHFNQHMIFRYCAEGSGEPVQTCRLTRAFAASTRDLDIYYIVQWHCLRKCADSPEYSLLAWIAHKSPFKAAQDILYRLDCANVQTRQILRCSHKMAFNRHLSHHMSILSCDEGSD